MILFNLLCMQLSHFLIRHKILLLVLPLVFSIKIHVSLIDAICLDEIQLWDASTGQAISHYLEHEKRAWSVDFSQVYPTKLASGSDDCSVKLWSINEVCSPSVSYIKYVAFFPPLKTIQIR